MSAAPSAGWKSARWPTGAALVVRVPVAEVRAIPDEPRRIVFRAEQNVLLELAEPATSASTTAMPGWVGVKHRDGQADTCGSRRCSGSERRPRESRGRRPA